MKRLLIILFGLAVVFIIVQKYGLFTFFLKNSKTTTEKQPTSTPVVEISPAVSQPIIGIHYRMIDKQTADQNKITEGAYITQVIEDSPAEKAGILEEDIIIGVDNNTIGASDKQKLTELISVKKPGDKVTFKIWRNDEIKIIDIYQ